MRVLFLLAAVLAAMASRPADAAVTLRPFGILDGPLVRLSDLFNGTGAAGRRILGPGPAPGQRITVPAAQLAAIASEFGVAWHPRSPGEQVVLERPGRPLRRAEAAAALGPALTAAGAPAHSGVVLSDFSPPDVPPGKKVAIAVRQLDYDQASQRFSAVLNVSASGMDAAEVPVAGHAEPMIRVLVAARFMTPGAIITRSDVRLAEVATSRITRAVASRFAQVEGLELTHAVAEGAPIALSDLAAPPLVKRGQRVLITLAAPGFALSEQGRALEAGARGADVRVLNPASRAVLEARVTGPDEVAVTEGSLPLRGPAERTHRGYPAYPEYAAQ